MVTPVVQDDIIYIAVQSYGDSTRTRRLLIDGVDARQARALKPSRLDDELIVGLEVEKLTRVRVVFRQHVRRGDVELVTGTVEIACVNMATMTPSAIPEFLHSKLEALK